MAITDSAWAFAQITLISSATQHSPWATATATLVVPAPVDDTHSPWAARNVRLRRPHLPIGVLTTSGVGYSPVLVYDGSDWR